jgi:CRISPR-associated protein Cmr3
VVLPGAAPPDALTGIDIIALGGEGRRARLEEAPPFAWPEAKPVGGQKSLALLTTPCLSAGGWKPSAMGGVVAAAIPAPVAVSGWDLANNGPRPTRFAAPAGSVYYLGDSAEGLPPSLADGPDRPELLGWGCYLKGVWSDHE